MVRSRRCATYGRRTRCPSTKPEGRTKQIRIAFPLQGKELSSRSINVDTIAPGAIETDFGGGQVRDNADLNAQIASLTTLGRAGLPDDIGGVVAFLCSEEARWITGQRIEVSGGMLL